MSMTTSDARITPYMNAPPLRLQRADRRASDLAPLGPVPPFQVPLDLSPRRRDVERVTAREVSDLVARLDHALPDVERIGVLALRIHRTEQIELGQRPEGPREIRRAVTL